MVGSCNLLARLYPKELSCSEVSSDGEVKDQGTLGAATYKTKFNRAWTKEFPFITSVPNELHR